MDKIELIRTEEGLTAAGRGMRLTADFSSILPRISPGRIRSESLVRACALKKEGERTTEGALVFDMTAGLGEDSFVLAGAGFEVVMFEADGIIAALLEDAVARGLEDPLTSPVLERMTLVKGDSIKLASAYVSEKGRRPDTVYLDPMFPAKKRGGLTGKKFQILHLIEEPCADEEGLLEAAFALDPSKVVIKRQAKGPYLAGRKPHYSIPGESIRYDCFYLHEPLIRPI